MGKGVQPKKEVDMKEDSRKVYKEEKELLEQFDIEDLQKVIEEKDKKAEEYLSMLQRVQAEFENYKKRVEKERIVYTEQANATLIMKLLSVLDNFERALAVECEDISFKKGIEMILNQLKNILEAEGLSAIEAAGAGFDPYYHEAVLAVEGDYDEDTVTEEFEKGYLFRNKVLRPSKVKVGRRGE
jgi:molecular chaperone GrpE